MDDHLKAMHELEWRLIFSVMVAGKSSAFAESATHKFCSLRNETEGPFDLIKSLIATGELEDSLIICRTGSYTRLGKCFKEIIKAEIDLKTCSVEELEKIHGIGPKTARFFVMWTRDDQNYAALDTHILKWMRYLGYNVPKSTPSGKLYAVIEKQFIAESEKRGMKPRDLDAAIWEYCRNGGHKSGNWPGMLEKL